MRWGEACGAPQKNALRFLGPRLAPADALRALATQILIQRGFAAGVVLTTSAAQLSRRRHVQ
jgi:hypothetical protein